eukprot:365447-Chlamydomonas_euryale.AAC.23
MAARPSSEACCTHIHTNTNSNTLDRHFMAAHPSSEACCWAWLGAPPARQARGALDAACACVCMRMCVSLIMCKPAQSSVLERAGGWMEWSARVCVT